MKRFAVIGDPIAHSLSTTLHHEIYKQLNIKAEYEKIQVEDNSMDLFINSNQLNGFNVTLPHKESIIPFLDRLDDAAQIIGAVNCVDNSTGYNTDWIGFSRAMEINGIDLNKQNCVLLGAGGAARAVAYALIMEKVKSITIVNRTIERAKNLVKWIKKISTIHTTQVQQLNKPQHYQIIINCTPIGMWPDIKSIPSVNFCKKNILVETIYNPLQTKWLKKGIEVKVKTVIGLDMFIAQGLASCDIWFKQNISKQVDLGKIKKVLKLKLC